MTPQEAVLLLRQAGMSDPSIAKAVKARAPKLKISAPTVNRVRNGRGCSWRTGNVLIQLAQLQLLQTHLAGAEGQHEATVEAAPR